MKTTSTIWLLAMLLCLTSLIGPPTVDAELVDITPALMLDTSTGLRWLDLKETHHLSYSAVTSQMGLGGQFQGFRYATVQEVQTLWQSAGIADMEATHGNYVPVTDLIVRLGWSVGSTKWTPNGWAGIYGLTGTPSPRYPNAYVGTVLGWSNVWWGQIAQASVQPDNYGNFIDVNFNGGHWLVMDTLPAPVPEPTSLVLLTSGLVGLAAKRRMRSM